MTQSHLGLQSKLRAYTPPDPGRNRPKTIDILGEMAVRVVPRDSRGRGAKAKLKLSMNKAGVLQTSINRAPGAPGGAGEGHPWVAAASQPPPPPYPGDIDAATDGREGEGGG